MNGGFFVFSRRIFDYLDDSAGCILERQPLSTLAEEGEIKVYRHTGFWQCMDVPKDRDMLDEHYARNGSRAADRCRSPSADAGPG